MLVSQEKKVATKSFKKNDTLRNVLLAIFACAAFVFAGCNQAVDDGGGNYVRLNGGAPSTFAEAADAIRTQRGGTIYVKLSNEHDLFTNGTWTDAFTGVGAAAVSHLDTVIDAMRENPNVMVELDLSEVWKDDDSSSGAPADPDIFGGQVNNVSTSPTVDEGARAISTNGFVSYELFAGLKNLKSISLPFTVVGIDTRAFYGCENLEEVTINYFFTSSVDKTNKYYSEFMYDDKFTLVVINDSAFEGCKSLKHFKLVSDPSNTDVDYGFPVSLSYIGEYAFKDCYSLESVRFYNTRNLGRGRYNTENQAWSRDSTIEGILQQPMQQTGDTASDFTYFGGNSTTAEAGRANVYYDSHNALTRFTDGITHVMTRARYGIPGMRPITIDEGAFLNCRSMEVFDFTNKMAVNSETAVVTDIDVTATTFDPFPRDASNAIDPDNAFANYVFSGCENLRTVAIPQALAARATDTQAMANVPVYTRYELGATRPGVNGTYNTIAGAGSFNPFVGFGDNSFEYTAVGNEVVRDMFHMTDFARPSAANGWQGVAANRNTAAGNAAYTDVVTEIGYRAFFGCRNLSEVELPSTITATTLGDGAFANTGVEYIWVHDYITTGTGAVIDPLYSILPGWKNKKASANDPYTETAPYWEGALVDEMPEGLGSDDPTTIYFWKRLNGGINGDLTYKPVKDSQNPNMRLLALGGALVDIRPDAFYNNVDVQKILFPVSLAGATANGIGDYAFTKTANLGYVAFVGDAEPKATPANDSWREVSQGVGAFSTNPAFEVHCGPEGAEISKFISK